LTALLCTCAVRAQQLVDDVDEDEFVIRKRPVDVAVVPEKEKTKPEAEPKAAPKSVEKKAPLKEEKALIDLLGTKLSDAEYRAEIRQIAMMLMDRKLTKEERDDLILAVTREVNRSSKAFGALLDWRMNPDVKLRLGAVEGIRLAYTGTVGAYLGASALSEPNASVRNAVIKLIKDRNDRLAMKYLFKTLLDSVENGETTAIGNSQLNSAAIAALRDIGDKQVYEVLLFLERVSMANGITGTPYIDGVKINPPNTDLQCMAPNSEVGMMQYTQTFPGLTALKAISGENFAHDLKKWQDWIDKQPAYKP
jgi:hypothetical protein